MDWFEKVTDRKNSNCCKWDGQDGDYLPFWVADMDFPSPEPIRSALNARVSHGVFGYGMPDGELLNAICRHYQETYGCKVERDFIVLLPGIMPGIHIACGMIGGDLFLHTPMYNKILAIKNNIKRYAVESKLKLVNGIDTFDFEAMEKEITPSVTTFILCNPHNPVGRVYTKNELEGIAEFCQIHDLVLISDEIHSEIILEGTHIPAFTLENLQNKNCITFSSAAKICNIPGIPSAFAIIPDETLRNRFIEASAGLFPPLSVLGMEAMKIAYTGCKEWKTELLTHLRKNREYLENKISNMPALTVSHNQGTYLSWIDATELARKLSAQKKDTSPWRFFLQHAGVHMSNGADYGMENFLRFNFACPRSQLEEGLDRMDRAINELYISEGNVS